MLQVAVRCSSGRRNTWAQAPPPPFLIGAFQGLPMLPISSPRALWAIVINEGTLFSHLLSTESFLGQNVGSSPIKTRGLWGRKDEKPPGMSLPRPPRIAVVTAVREVAVWAGGRLGLRGGSHEQGRASRGEIGT